MKLRFFTDLITRRHSISSIKKNYVRCAFEGGLKIAVLTCTQSRNYICHLWKIMILQLVCLSLHDYEIFVANLKMQIISFMAIKKINLEMFV